MPFYDEKYYMDTLRWDDIFKTPAEFVAKVIDVGGITDPVKLAELYQVLAFKYVSSFTRYTTEFPFIMAIKRELHTEFPFYFKKKELAEDMMDMEIAEIQQQTRQLRNLVDTHDEPIVNASTTPINDLSTQQEYIGVKINELEAVKQKYAVMNKNYLHGIYARCDELFRVMLTEDTIPLYEG
jgi:hypothetical protein